MNSKDMGMQPGKQFTVCPRCGSEDVHDTFPPIGMCGNCHYPFNGSSQIMELSKEEKKE